MVTNMRDYKERQKKIDIDNRDGLKADLRCMWAKNSLERIVLDRDFEEGLDIITDRTIEIFNKFLEST